MGCCKEECIHFHVDKIASQASVKWTLNINSSFVCMPVLEGVTSARGMKCYTVGTPEFSVSVLRRWEFVKQQQLVAQRWAHSSALLPTFITILYSALCNFNMDCVVPNYTLLFCTHQRLKNFFKPPSSSSSMLIKSKLQADSKVKAWLKCATISRRMLAC